MTVVETVQNMLLYEQLSLLLLVPANVLYTVAATTHAWFELPGVAWYGLWWSKFCDNTGECHFIPAFFTNEPAFYHLLQCVFVLGWMGLGLSVFMLLSTKMDCKLPRVFKKNRHQAIAFVCFASVFAISGGLYLFYYIINDFPHQSDKYPKIQWAAMFAAAACGFTFTAGLLLLQL